MEDISWQKMAINLLAGVALTVLLIAIVLLRKLYIRKIDAAQLLYLKFCKKSSRGGLMRAAHEGPQDFAARAIMDMPQHAEAIRSITDLYLAMRYENQPDESGLRALRRAVRAFKI